MNNSDLIDLLTTCKTICGTEAKFYSRFKTGSVHAVMPSKFYAIDHALDKAIAALSAKPEPSCGTNISPTQSAEIKRLKGLLLEATHHIRDPDIAAQIEARADQ